MVTRREDGPLLAVMASLIVGVLNGTLRSSKKFAPGTWFGFGAQAQGRGLQKHILQKI
jgi:hypothetical protein